MTGATPAPEGYRPCAGIVLFNRDGLVFAGRRTDTRPPAWQFPQGGINPDESPEKAALRELAEETGTDRAVIVGSMDGWLTYDLPRDLAARMWGGRYRGQAQKWFLAGFTGEDEDIDIAAGDPPEFDAWRWMTLSDVAAQIVPFKREVYTALVPAFANRIARETAAVSGPPSTGPSREREGRR